MSPLALSVLLSLVSAVAYAAAAIVQERVAASAASAYAPVRSGAWWVSVLLNGVGAVLHVAALAYGPLSLVQPLGALTIVFALPMAALFAGRRAGSTAWRGAVTATVGLAGLLALTGGSQALSLPGGDRLTLAACAFGAVAALFLTAARISRPVVRGMVLAAAAGISFGLASVFTKIVATDFTLDAPLGEWPAMLATAGFAVGGLLLSQASYRGAGLAAPLATVTVVNPVVAATIGLTLFGEDFRFGAAGTAIAVCFGVVAAGGLVLLTTQRPVPVAAPPRPDSGQDAARPAGPARPLAASEGDAPRPEVGERVDVGPVSGSRAHLEVQVRSRAVAGGS
ncbi:DMT family transporter [Streptomyces purpureus]|uniref:Integral membrane protein n=1 Tax=Streptomyces purpureus TaxID=1951 RepID=A0A918GW02_9ACTN|nr:DMT family transporter [Streptomyces purpureus]GGT13087.1 hypothetical protein GCM10014713_01970 [Streptomyces purpureus]